MLILAASSGIVAPVGFWNSGVMDRDNRTPLPPSNAVTFGEAGTFDFYCLIHPFMKATVTVK